MYLYSVVLGQIMHALWLCESYPINNNISHSFLPSPIPHFLSLVHYLVFITLVRWMHSSLGSIRDQDILLYLFQVSGDELTISTVLDSESIAILLALIVERSQMQEAMKKHYHPKLAVRILCFPQ